MLYPAELRALSSSFARSRSDSTSGVTKQTTIPRLAGLTRMVDAFDVIHGAVGSVKERHAVVSWLSPSQTDARDGLPAPAGELDECSERGFDACGNAALCSGSDVPTEDHELVTAVPCHIVSWPQRVPETSCNDAQHFVSGIMAKSVIH